MSTLSNENVWSLDTPIKDEPHAQLQEQDIVLPPVQFEIVSLNVSLPQTPRFIADGVLDAVWGKEKASYLFEYKSRSLPQLREEAIVQACSYAAQVNLLPLVILPYLDEAALRDMEARGVSGIDLCGNGVLLAPTFRVWRTGNPNRFKDSRPIYNPYRGDSSIFVRCFLLRPEYPSLTALQEFAHERTLRYFPHATSKGLALGTASKVVQYLEEELLVEKKGNAIHLVDRKRLLHQFRGAFQNVRDVVRPTLMGKTSLASSEIWLRLSTAQASGSLRYVATGLASAAQYRVLSGIDRLSLYVDDLEAVGKLLEVRASRAFANIQLKLDTKQAVYFDTRQNAEGLWASPIQTWLELSQGGPREQEAAEELERLLSEGHGEKLL